MEGVGEGGKLVLEGEVEVGGSQGLLDVDLEGDVGVPLEARSIVAD